MRRATAESPGVSLFPFLAVLLCTMGALVVVLVVINRQTRQKAVAAAEQDAAHDEQLAIAEEQLALQVSQLTKARDKTLADLETARKRLSGVEDHSRRIQKQIEDLVAAAKKLPDPKSAAASQRDALRAELARINTERMRLEADLSQARKAAKFRKPAFAVVPFDGIHRTHRRPIYIECRADSIILQPEGIVFTRSDFSGPSGPGNPLAAALRAAREYWSQQPPPAADIPNEPYPLLLVRPDGIIGYYLAREAMASWNSEFGYELVDADWTLDFPLPPQPQLKEMEERAVADARLRLEWLAQANPERFAQRPKTQYRLAAGRGGLVPEGGASLGNDPFESDPLGGFGLRSTTRYPSAVTDDRYGLGNVGPYTGEGGTGLGEPSTGLHGGANPQRDGTGGQYVRDAGSTGSNGFVEAGRGSGFNGQGTESPLTGELGAGGRGSADRGLADRGGGYGGGPMSETVGERYSGTANGSHRSGTGQGPGASILQDANSSGAAGSSAPGGYAAASQGSPSGSSAAAGQPSFGSAASSGASGDPSSASSGAPSPSLELNTNQPVRRTASRSVADSRGRNWALPGSNNASVPITRPIRLECWPDRVVVMPDARDGKPQVIRVTSRTEDSVDELVAAVRQHARQWGIAGTGMYWKPQLVLHVNPSGEGRAQDLETLLANSGLDVKRK